MKRRGLIVMIIMAGLTSLHVYAIKHSLTNKSNKTIDVYMSLHGESMLGKNAEDCLKSGWTSCCRREKKGLKPGEWVEWDTKGCQLKRVRIIEEGTGRETVANIQNASKTVAKNVAATATVVLLLLGSANQARQGDYGGSYLSHRAATDIAKQDYTTAELVAYGSTSWVYTNDALEAVTGVKMYRK